MHTRTILTTFLGAIIFIAYFALFAAYLFA